MLITRTLFDNHGRPLGRAIEDDRARRVQFEPRPGFEHLAGRTWRSLEACRRSVISASAPSAQRSKTA